jgi:hypothetical protein
MAISFARGYDVGECPGPKSPLAPNAGRAVALEPVGEEVLPVWVLEFALDVLLPERDGDGGGGADPPSVEPDDEDGAAWVTKVLTGLLVDREAPPLWLSAAACAGGTARADPCPFTTRGGRVTCARGGDVEVIAA